MDIAYNPPVYSEDSQKLTKTEVHSRKSDSEDSTMDKYPSGLIKLLPKLKEK